MDSDAEMSAAGSAPAAAGERKVQVVGCDRDHREDGHHAAEHCVSEHTRDAPSDSDDDDPAHRLVLPTDVGEISAATEVFEHIGTQGQKVTVIDGLDVCAARLKLLNLRSNLIRRMLGVGALTELRELELYDNKIEALEDLDELRSLETLDMSYNRVRRIGGALRTLRSLRTLYLAANRVARIEGLESCTALQRLDLGSNAIREIEGVAALCSLQELWLGKNKLSSVVGLGHLTQLRVLDLQSNRLVHIQGLETLVNLEELYLGHNGIRVIEGLDNLKKLTTVDLTANRVQQVQGLDGLHCIKDLWLGSNQIASFDCIVPLTSLPALEVLYLEHNPLASDFEYRMRIARELPRLQQLDATQVLRRG